MRRGRISLLIFLLAIISSTHAQETPYQPLQSSGSIPEAFRKDLIEEFEARIVQDSLIDRKKDKEVFYKSSTFFLSRLYQSGMVLFNDEVSNYLNGIKDILIKDKPELKDKIRVYTIKYESVNAFTTPDGGIFVNIGLLARLQNEDELAFVLAHEIAHYIHQHSIVGYNQQRKIDQKYSGNDDAWQSALEKCQYSQDAEKEADLTGLGLFEDSKYSWKALSNLFTILKESTLPVFKVKDNISTLNNSYVALKDSMYNVLSEDAIEDEDENEDTSTLSTHPEPELRKKILLEKAKKTNDQLKSSEQFRLCSEKCRYEMLKIYNDNFDFFVGYYFASYMLEGKPNDPFLNYQRIRSAYGITRLMVHNKVDRAYPSLNYKYDDFLNKFHDFFKNDLSYETAANWTIGYCEEYLKNQSYRKDEVQSIVADMVKWTEDTFNKSSNEMEILQPLTKVEKAENVILLEDEEINFYDPTYEYKGIKGKSLIVLNPDFARINAAKKDNQINYNFSIEKQQMYNEKLTTNSEKVDLHIDLLDVKTLKEGDIDKWNDIVDLMAFTHEIAWTDKLDDWVSTHTQNIETVKNKYDADDIMITAALSIRTPKTYIDIAIPLTLCVAVIPIPFALYSMIRPNEHGLFFSKVISLENGQCTYQYENYMKIKANNGVIGANVHLMLNEIKKAGK